MEQIVTGCEDCPMFDDGRNEYRLICNHPNAPNQYYQPLHPELEVKNIEIEDSGTVEDLDYIESVITPDWCPLIIEPITIIKK